MKIYGIFGFPLKHTLSPAMQEAAFGKLGIEAAYLPFELDSSNFRKVARNFSRTPLAGFNLTVPYKEMVLPYLDGVQKEAALIGAVNTVKRLGKKFWGYNTDWEGFLRALREARFEIRGRKAVILGAGGAARACVYGLVRQGMREISIFNRHPDKAYKILRDFKHLSSNASIKSFGLDRVLLKRELETADLLVNTTNVGLERQDSVLVSRDMFPSKRLFVYDLIYNPSETPLLKMARKKNYRTLNGLTMLLYQGCRAFEIWVGRKAPEKIMRKVLEKSLTARKG